MRKLIAFIFTFVTMTLLGAVQAYADISQPVVPATGDENWWIYIVLAIVAVAMVLLLAVTNKKK